MFGNVEYREMNKVDFVLWEFKGDLIVKEWGVVLFNYFGRRIMEVFGGSFYF